MRDMRLFSYLVHGSRDGEAPAEPRAAIDFKLKVLHAEGSGGGGRLQI